MQLPPFLVYTCLGPVFVVPFRYSTATSGYARCPTVALCAVEFACVSIFWVRLHIFAFAGLSQLAARTLASYLSAPHRFVPVRRATAELSLDCVATHGWQPRWIHSELTLGKLARRFQLFVVGLLQANHIPIRAGSSLHLSEFGFNRVPSIYLHKKFMFPDRKKFRSQTSDNMDKWKAEMGRVSEEKRRRKKIKNKGKIQKKEDPGARKGRKVAQHRVFSMICGSGGSKSRLAKAAGAEPAGQMRDEKLHAVVARSTFPSQNVQSTPGPDHFWKLRCRENARRCGEKHVSKSKCRKHLNFGALLEVALSKKFTPLWREAHFEVKMLKKNHMLGPLYDVQMSFRVAGARDSAKSE